jgi:uncharacterized protein (TIGR02246 family)
MANTQPPAKVVQQLYELLEEGRFDEYASNFAEDAKWIEPTGSVFGGTYRGRDQIRELMERASKDWWEEFEVEVDRLVVDGDTVIAITTTSGTYRSSGVRASARAAHLYVVRDGLITRMESFEDTASLNRAIDSEPSGLSELGATATPDRAAESSRE